MIVERQAIVAAQDSPTDSGSCANFGRSAAAQIVHPVRPCLSSDVERDSGQAGLDRVVHSATLARVSRNRCGEALR